MQTKLISIKQVAEVLGVSVNTVRNWVRGYYDNGTDLRSYTARQFIEPVRIGRLIRFKESELNRWIENNRSDH